MTKTQSEILVRNLKMGELAEQIPHNVFLITVDVIMSRTQSRDNYVSDEEGQPFRYSRRPFDVKLATSTPYVPHKTIYFYNPIEFPDSGEKAWDFEEFTEHLADAAELIENFDPKGTERLYLQNLRLCEIPERYAYIDENGRRRVDSDVYADRAEVSIGSFEKRPKVKTPDARDDLRQHDSTFVPGRILKPLKLTDIEVVHAKQHRGTNQTVEVKTKRAYFSEAQAQKYNNPNLSPREIRPTWYNVSDPSEGAFPTLAATDFMDEVEFTGETSQSEEFIEESARIVSQ